MKINLRKTAAIQQEILQKIKSLQTIDHDLEFDEFDKSVEEKFKKANTKYMNNHNMIINLYDVYYKLREKIAVINYESGVNNLLTEIEFCKKQIEVHTIISNLKSVANFEAISMRLDKIRQTPLNEGYYNKTVDTTCLTEVDIENSVQKINLLKQEIRELNDALLEKNMKSEINLEPKLCETLSNTGIL